MSKIPVRVLPDRLFAKLWQLSFKYESSDSYIKDICYTNGKAYINFKDKYGIYIDESTEMLSRIYGYSHLQFKELCDKYKIKKSSIKNIFCIPQRTIDRWYSGETECKSYIILQILRYYNLLELGKYIYVSGDYNAPVKKIYKTNDVKKKTNKRVKRKNYKNDDDFLENVDRMLEQITEKREFSDSLKMREVIKKQTQYQIEQKQIRKLKLNNEW